MKARPHPSSTSASSARARAGVFPHLLDVDALPAEGKRLTIEATPAQCDAVAAESGLPAVAALKVKVRVVPHAGGRVEVTGDLTARITEICVVSLEPFESEVTQDIDLVFAPEAPPPLPERAGRGSRHKTDRDYVASAPVPGNDDQEDPPDPIVDGTIDLGAVAVEFLNLARDPYPKKPGIAFDDVVVGEEDEKPSPFAALERLKNRP